VPKPIRVFVRAVDAVNTWIGHVAMYLFFVLGAVMLYSTLSRALFGVPVNWALEMSQFLLSAYYLLGGAYATRLDAHVRMDLFYGRLAPRRRSQLDAFTIVFVIFFLIVLLWGGLSSTQYAIQYNQKNYSAWSPILWPVKVVMSIGIFLMLLQFIALFFRNIAEARGRPLE
jgi:TRAP-type mannitol/chloroaromatic compound transport system permease small subunit